MFDGLEPPTLVNGGNITVGVPSETVGDLQGLAGNPGTVADTLSVLASLGVLIAVWKLSGSSREAYSRKTTDERINTPNRDETLVRDRDSYRLGMLLSASYTRKIKK
jgi:hypothetical protein